MVMRKITLVDPAQNSYQDFLFLLGDSSTPTQVTEILNV